MTGRHQHCLDIFRLPQSSHLPPGEVLLNFQSGSHDSMFHDDTIPLYYLPIQLRTYTHEMAIRTSYRMSEKPGLLSIYHRA